VTAEQGQPRSVSQAAAQREQDDREARARQPSNVNRATARALIPTKSGAKPGSSHRGPIHRVLPRFSVGLALESLCHKGKGILGKRGTVRMRAIPDKSGLDPMNRPSMAVFVQMMRVPDSINDFVGVNSARGVAPFTDFISDILLEKETCLSCN